jgi:hypothetical protein
MQNQQAATASAHVCAQLNSLGPALCITPRSKIFHFMQPVFQLLSLSLMCARLHGAQKEIKT